MSEENTQTQTQTQTQTETNSKAASTEKKEIEDPIKLFVGQIPRDWKEPDLRQLMAPFGDIVEVVIITNRMTGQSQGCGFVTFRSKKQADEAIEQLHLKRVIAPVANPVQVKYADSELEKLENKLFVGMVPKTATENDLEAIFAGYGQVTEIAIHRTPDGMSKGAAFVKMSSRAEALEAVNALNGKFQMDGGVAPLVVKFADTAKQKQEKMRSQVPPVGGYDPSGFGFGGFSNYMGYGQAAGSTAFPGYGGMGQGNFPLGNPMSLYQNPNTASMGAQPFQMPRTPHSEGPQGCNLFIYHLPATFTDADLYAMFSPFGNIVSSSVYIDKMTGQSKGFGFVSFDNPQSAQNAIQGMNGFQVGNKRLKVQLKKPKGT